MLNVRSVVWNAIVVISPDSDKSHVELLMKPLLDRNSGCLLKALSSRIISSTSVDFLWLMLAMQASVYFGYVATLRVFGLNFILWRSCSGSVKGEKLLGLGQIWIKITVLNATNTAACCPEVSLKIASVTETQS